MFPSFLFGKHCFCVSFCFQDANYAYDTQHEVLTKIRACEQLQKICKNEQASTHLIFASNSSEGQILRALSNWTGPLIPLIIPSWLTMTDRKWEIQFIKSLSMKRILNRNHFRKSWKSGSGISNSHDIIISVDSCFVSLRIKQNKWWTA